MTTPAERLEVAPVVRARLGREAAVAVVDLVGAAAAAFAARMMREVGVAGACPAPPVALRAAAALARAAPTVPRARAVTRATAGPVDELRASGLGAEMRRRPAHLCPRLRIDADTFALRFVLE
jgi:hypothetical protein